MKSAYLIALTALLSTLDVATAAWQKLPVAESVPMNLALESIEGTKIVSATGVSNSQALIANDPSQFAKLSAGGSSAVIDISGQTMVEFVSFSNEGAAGRVSVSASTNNKDWTALSQQTFDGSSLVVALKFAGIQAKYVKFSFDLAKSGSISNVKLLGAKKVSDYRMYYKASPNAITDASISSPIYVFPTPTNIEELGSGRGVYKFPKTNEKYRTIIYDLGGTQTLKKFSAAYSKIPTRVEVFGFEQLPEKKDWRGKITFDPSILDSTKPVATGEDASGAGHLSIVSSKPVTAKYIVMRFEPNYSKSVTGLSIEWQPIASAALIPFSGVASQLGVLNLSSAWQPVAGAGDGPFVVINITTGNNNVFIPKQSGGGTPDNNGGGTPGEDIADPVLSNALSGFGLSAYRNGGTGGVGGGTALNALNSNAPSNDGTSRAIVVITQTVNPTTP